MKRTISVMLGKGSISHNSRKFKAVNIDAERTPLNQCYSDKPIKEVYNELFDEALERYNEKQTRNDRRIEDYYEKIRTGKQEKLFHEVILQIGNRDDMNAASEHGELAASVLDEYMRRFEERNPNLKVFSAHLHMDEATPHLHIDFVPFITNSKRGLDTRVSLKQALAAQGFKGESRGANEWNKWVQSEKEELAQIMKERGIEWEQKGTHNQHLSVMDYKKEQRTKEVQALEEEISGKQTKLLKLEERSEMKQAELDQYLEKLGKTKNKLQRLATEEKFVANNARQYDDDPEYQLPEPKPLMTAKSYHDKMAAPLVRQLKDAIRSILLQFARKTGELKTALDRANGRIDGLMRKLDKYEKENTQLKAIEKNYGRLSRAVGKDVAEQLIEQEKRKEVPNKTQKRTVYHER